MTDGDNPWDQVGWDGDDWDASDWDVGELWNEIDQGAGPGDRFVAGGDEPDQWTLGAGLDDLIAGRFDEPFVADGLESVVDQFTVDDRSVVEVGSDSDEAAVGVDRGDDEAVAADDSPHRADVVSDDDGAIAAQLLDALRAPASWPAAAFAGPASWHTDVGLAPEPMSTVWLIGADPDAVDGSVDPGLLGNG